jgi:hypothetical protein
MSEVSPHIIAAKKAHAWAREEFPEAYKDTAAQSVLHDARLFCMYAIIARVDFAAKNAETPNSLRLSEELIDEHAKNHGRMGVEAHRQAVAEDQVAA